MFHELVMAFFQGIAFALLVWALLYGVTAMVALRRDPGPQPPSHRVAMTVWAPRRVAPPRHAPRLGRRRDTDAPMRRTTMRPRRTG